MQFKAASLQSYRGTERESCAINSLQTWLNQFFPRIQLAREEFPLLNTVESRKVRRIVSKDNDLSKPFSPTTLAAIEIYPVVFNNEHLFREQLGWNSSDAIYPPPIRRRLHTRQSLFVPSYKVHFSRNVRK